MADHISSVKRSILMRKIQGKNTKPEVLLRKNLHRLGLRFRLHSKDLPGKPDIVLPKYKTCVFVHGCFWHQHPGCSRATRPKSNSEFWEKKLARNVERDELVISSLKEIGWRVYVIWECDIKSASKAAEVGEALFNLIRS